MQPIVRKAHSLLIKAEKTLAVAESCTGGLLAKLLTDLPGSSRYFTLGIVAYSNTAKETILKIPSLQLRKKGAVSKETAKAMAHAVRLLAKSDVSIGITGIAGPQGASIGKPVGTVFIAIENKSKNRCEKFTFSGTRASVRLQAALKSLELLPALITSSTKADAYLYRS